MVITKFGGPEVLKEITESELPEPDKGQVRIKVLRNESVVLTRNGDLMGMGGVENWGTASQPRKGDLNLASEGLKDQPFNLLMSHDPDHWDKQFVPRRQ